MDKVNNSETINIEGYKEEFKKNTSAWDYLISQNRYSSKIFKRAFAFNGEMLEIGYPRNDILVNENNEAKIIIIQCSVNNKDCFFHLGLKIETIT